MMNLMIVDDEERARNGIRSLIDWPSFEISIVAEARDGAEALERMRSHRVDILLTDIRMPEMDGLELIQQVTERYPETKCAIMSGHDEFAYAQKAMAIGVSHYLLKPSRRQEILDLILSLKEEILAEQRETQRLEELKAGFRESFPLLKENSLSRLVLSENPPYARLLGNLESNGLRFSHPYFGVIILQIDNFHELQKHFGGGDIELFKYALKNIAEEMLAPICSCAAFEHQDDLVLVLNTGEEFDADSLTPYAEVIQQNAKRFLKFTVSVGIGSMAMDIHHLRPSYLEAERALNAHYYRGNETIAFRADAVEEEEAADTSYPLSQEKAVLQAVLLGDDSAIRDTLERFLTALRPESASKDSVLNSVIALYFALYRCCVERNVNVQDIFGRDLKGIGEMLSRSNLAGIMNELAETAIRVGRQLNEKKNGNKLFESVLTYIRDNFRKNISRETVAREVFITPGYVSLLFKQQMQTSFLEYLHRIRIERACRLLEDKSLRIADIAHDVGYQDEKYFFQVFKKHTGMTPMQYRNQMTGEN